MIAIVTDLGIGLVIGLRTELGAREKREKREGGREEVVRFFRSTRPLALMFRKAHARARELEVLGGCLLPSAAAAEGGLGADHVE